MTPHINAKLQDIAEVVLMSGDPLRAKWIAGKFLDKPRLVNDIRVMHIYTGYYNKKKVTVMGHGMGIPSIGIYSYELFNFYNTKYIIRLGSAGSINKNINLGDIFIADESYSNSSYASEIGVNVTNNKILKCDKKLKILATRTAKELKIPFFSGRVFSMDAFYSKYSLNNLKATKSDMLEMEAFGLYANAIKCKRSALTILTCSDSLITKKSLSPAERENTFVNMAELGLKLADKLSKNR